MNQQTTIIYSIIINDNSSSERASVKDRSIPDSLGEEYVRDATRPLCAMKVLVF